MATELEASQLSEQDAPSVSGRGLGMTASPLVTSPVWPGLPDEWPSAALLACVLAGVWESKISGPVTASWLGRLASGSSSCGWLASLGDPGQDC
jgi:hypothetical protein